MIRVRISQIQKEFKSDIRVLIDPYMIKKMKEY